MATFKPSNILVFGATGNIGRYIMASILSAQPSFSSVSIFTSPSTAHTKASLLESWKAKGLASVITGDMTSAADVRTAYASNGGIDTVISCVGRGIIANQIELLRVADEEESSVRWFFPSEYGTDVEFGPESATERPHQFKLQVRRFVRENVKRVAVTYLVTGPYADMWINIIPLAPAAGGFDWKEKRVVLVEDGEGKIALTTMPDVGVTLVAALRHPSKAMSRALKVKSFVTTPKAVLAEFERRTGPGWTVSYTPLDDLRRLEERLVSENSPAATGVTLRRIWSQGGTLYDKWDNADIGLPEELVKMEDFVVRAVSGELGKHG